MGVSRKNTIRSLIEIKNSKLFDLDHYRKQSGKRHLSLYTAIYHYIISGERRGLSANPGFDPKYYLTANPDLNGWSLPLFVHYVRYGHKEGRAAKSPTSATDGISKSIKRVIIDSGEFDLDYYAMQSGERFKNIDQAVRHYLAKGESRGFKPNPDFDPVVYRSYSDLKNYGALFYHYLLHGRKEGRIGNYDFSSCFRPGKRVYDESKETVALVIHEGSFTGAPILGINLLEQFSQTHNIVLISLRDGPLLRYAADFAVKIVVGDVNVGRLSSELLAAKLIRPLISEFNVTAALANSVETAAIVAALSTANVAIVSLIHEFATYVQPLTLSTVLACSQRVVFSSSLTQKSALEAGITGHFRHSVVRPQGRCVVPDVGATATNDTSRTRSKPHVELGKSDFLCIGCGYVQYRKGVDLFIATAAAFRRLNPSTKAAFVWVGEGYDPINDLGYSAWLKDQIQRSGLDDVVVMMPAMDAKALLQLYGMADAMLLSSRLDPFPNVAIDAIAEGLPLVSFKDANGVSEYLEDDELLASLVVPYLDIEAAAAALIKLQSGEKRSRKTSEHLKRLAANQFNMVDYVDDLQSLLDQAVAVSRQERTDVETILEHGGVDFDMLGIRDSPDQKDVVSNYVRLCAGSINRTSNGIERRPIPGFYPAQYAASHPSLAELPYENAYAHFLRAGRPSGPWIRDVVQLQQSDKPAVTLKDAEVALHIHLHYPDQALEICRRISLNRSRPTLLITVTETTNKSVAAEAFADYSGSVEIRVVPNKGRDIGPFLCGFKDRVSDFKVIGHIHSKKSMDIAEDTVSVWRDFLLETLLGGRYKALDQILAAFDRNPKLGLIYPEDPQSVGWTENFGIATRIAPRVGLSSVPEFIEFPVGNMFFARTKALNGLFGAEFELSDFPEEPVAYDGTILHALERLTPVIVEDAGYSVKAIHGKGLTR
ncbi:rhamnan synthesis F family protein [Georhizobium sp. MAB10]|uniref:rhamnan synthesis F family protein n=1 Tax=Georhizobium sp. MAB10 TaxID=3028319 RepID=UPI0038560A69